MKRVAVVIAAALGLATNAAADAEQFNLVCSGTMDNIVPYLMKNEVTPYTRTLRVDLAAGKWCEGECSVQSAFERVTPTALVISERKADTPREHEEHLHVISRETGEETELIASGVGSMQMLMRWKGQCERAAFTGFPPPPPNKF